MEKREYDEFMRSFTDELEERVIWLGWSFDMRGVMVYVKLPWEAVTRYDLQWEFVIRPYMEMIGDQVRVSFHLGLVSDLGMLRRLLDASEDALQKAIDEGHTSDVSEEPCLETVY